MPLIMPFSLILSCFDRLAACNGCQRATHRAQTTLIFVKKMFSCILSMQILAMRAVVSRSYWALALGYVQKPHVCKNWQKEEEKPHRLFLRMHTCTGKNVRREWSFCSAKFAAAAVVLPFYPLFHLGEISTGGGCPAGKRVKKEKNMRRTQMALAF